jgi:hypothetical protein
MSTTSANSMPNQHQMIRFPTFHETPTCAQAKTATSSLKEILAKCSKNAVVTDRAGATLNSKEALITTSKLSPPLPTREIKKTKTR